MFLDAQYARVLPAGAVPLHVPVSVRSGVSVFLRLSGDDLQTRW